MGLIKIFLIVFLLASSIAEAAPIRVRREHILKKRVERIELTKNLLSDEGIDALHNNIGIKGYLKTMTNILSELLSEK